MDRTVGLGGVRADITMLRTPDGHGRVELSRFHSPPAVRTEPASAPYEDLYRLCFLRGPEGIVIGLAERLS